MNTDILAVNIYKALNKELFRRTLVKYFYDRGFKESMDKRVYPPAIQDIVVAVPKLVGKIELQPYVEDVNPLTGVVTLGWNLFTLGNKRMFLGNSTHTNLNSLNTMIRGPICSEGIRNIEYRTPKEIISFLISTLGNSKESDLGGNTPTNVQSGILSLPGMMSDNGGFFKKNTFVN